MAIYRQGQASMDAQGYVTGYDTKWREQLTLIRPGATIFFLTQPLQAAVITEVISDTSIRAITTGGAVVQKTNYLILLHDSLTVDGLAQDVAETLRYYQSKETEIADALEFFRDFDLDGLKDLVNQVKQGAESAKQSASAAKTSETNAVNARNDAEQFKNAAKSSQDSARASQIAADASQAAAKTSETNAKSSETAAKTSQAAAKTSETNAKASENAAMASKTAAAASATAAKTSETNSKTSETNAKASETAANTAKTQAEQSAQSADASKTAAAGSATAAAGSATAAKNEADRAQRLADSFETDKLMQKENNLSDVADKAKARDNLALKGMAIQDPASVNITGGHATLNSTYAKPLLISSSNPTIMFSETDKPTGMPDYAFVFDGGAWRIQRQDSGAALFSYQPSPQTLKSHANHYFSGFTSTQSYSEVGQIRTTGKYAQDSILIRAISDNTGFVSYMRNDKVVFRAGMDTTKAYAIYRYNDDGTYHSTPFVIGAPGYGSQFNETLTLSNGNLIANINGPGVIVKPGSANGSCYVAGNNTDNSSLWYVGRGADADDVTMYNYKRKNYIALSSTISLRGSDVETSNNVIVGGPALMVKGGAGTDNTHLWLRNTSGRSRGVIYAADANILTIRSDNGATGAIGQGMTLNGNTGEVRATTFTNTSDERAKFWIKPVTGALEKLCSLKGVTYSMHTTIQDTVRNAGLIAQDVQKVLPEAVKVLSDAQDSCVIDKDCRTVEKPLGLDYNAMSALYVEAFKEMKAEIDNLKAEIEQLKNNNV